MPLSCAKFRFCSGLAAIDALWPSGRAARTLISLSRGSNPVGPSYWCLIKTGSTLVFVFEMMDVYRVQLS